jgi:hypothetical protein
MMTSMVSSLSVVGQASLRIVDDDAVDDGGDDVECFVEQHYVGGLTTHDVAKADRGGRRGPGRRCHVDPCPDLID